MGNLINLPNISPEAVENLTFDVEAPASTGFKTTNYLNTRLEEGEKSREIVIRLLPMDLQTGSPFVKASFHSIRVSPEISKSGFKSFLCLQRNPEINHEKFGNSCPFCEMNKKAYEASLKETDPIKKKNLQTISLDNHHKDAIIARCIERGKESEGVKFWKFNLSSRNNDPYHQIMDLYSQDRKQAAARGIDSNIFDLYNGYDIILTLKQNETNNKDKFTSTNVSIARYPSPLSTSEDDMRKWIYDEKKWTDVFTPKPYDYMKLISEDRIPWFDKSIGKWVDKAEYEKGKNSAETQMNEDIRSAEQEIRGYTEYPQQTAPIYGNQPVNPVGRNAAQNVPAQDPSYFQSQSQQVQGQAQYQQGQDFLQMMSVKDEELPF